MLVSRFSLPCFYSFVFFLVLLLQFPAGELIAGQQVEHGKVYGLKETIYPPWFKNSFLELADDVAEAADNNKRIMLIFYQDLCPYCYELVNKNLSQASTENYLKEHFDVIAMHMWGGRDVVGVDGNSYTEKSFARMLGVQFTPTIVFLDESGNEVLRLNGYLRPRQFRQALEYVAQHKEKSLSYQAYIAEYNGNSGTGNLNEEPYFSRQHDLRKLLQQDRPLAVFFEQADCPDCDYLHSKILSRTETSNIIKKFNNVQLDMWSDQKVITPEGKKMSAREWARQLGVSYAPTIVMFDPSGTEVLRMEAVFENFHVQSTFDYVQSGAYRDEPIIENYYKARARRLLNAGVDIHVWND